MLVRATKLFSLYLPIPVGSPHVSCVPRALWAFNDYWAAHVSQEEAQEIERIFECHPIKAVAA
jgi:hypothetical protein